MRKEIIKLYKSNLSVRQVAKKVGISPITVSRRLKEWNIKARPFKKVSKYLVDEHYFDDIDNEEKAYWLGFLLADGCVRTNSNMFSVNLSTIDLNHLEKLRKCLKSDNKIYYQSGGKHGMSCLTISNFYLANSLRNKGIVANKKWVYDVLPELQRHFWRGVVDGDGCIYNGSNKTKSIPIPQMQLSLVGTPETLKRFYGFCCGIITTKAKIKEKCCNKNMDFFRLHGWKALKICDALYENATVCLDRKMKKYLAGKEKFLTHRIQAVPSET
jgi:intein-encoded DNA endonuclease-like protein